MTAIKLFGLICFALLGGPLFVLIGAGAIIGFHDAGIDLTAIIIELNRLTNSPTLITIPLFTFAGYVLAESKAPKRLIGLAEAWFGWIPGGLPIVVLVACAFFTTFTGASGVTIVALGGLMFPILLKNYSERFSLGLITSSGSLGLLFPPSLPLILYGIVAESPIDRLFLAGIIPGFLLIIILSFYGSYWSTHSKVAKTPFRFNAALKSLWQTKWEALLPFMLLLAIYSGITTIAEAATLTVVYALLVEIIIYKDINITRLPKIIKESMVLVGAILIILGVALGFTNFLVDQEVPMKALSFIQEHIHSKLVFLLAINCFLLIIGCLMDIFSAIIVVVPLLTPIAVVFGIDPIHLGIIFLANLEIGYLTPPVGINLFISSLKFQKSIVRVYVSVLPFIVLLILALLLITYIPQLSLWLPRIIG
ncbi:MAG: TRAP transporter large permease subunit [Candidatus Aminicenantes bacterium]